MIDSSAASAATSSDLSPSDLQLRVRGGQHGGRLIRLVGDRLTIGSAPNSSLRLLAPGICPTHCLIVRGPQGAVVRHWSGDARLNGKSFTDEWLRAGDLLRVGSVELEVPADRSVPTLDEAKAIPATPPIDGETDEPTPSSDDISTEQFQGRLQLLLEHQRQLSERERELENRQAELESERQQWSHEREAELAELDAREECLRALREEIETARKSNARDEEWTQERERLLATLQQTQQERDEWKRMVDEMSGPQHADLDPPTAASAPANIPLQTTDEPATHPEVPSPATQDVDEFSIEAYMSQLLQRVGGRPAESIPTESTPPAGKPATEQPVTKPQPTKPVEPVNADPELTPRARPLPVDLGALRDVANQTARLAIERHARRLWWQAAAGKWFVVAVAMIAVCGLVYWAAHGKTPSGFGLFAAALVTIVWSAQAIWLTQRAVRTRLSEQRARKHSACEVAPQGKAPKES